MKISREDVLRVAELAHLDLSPEEVDLYGGQLDEILSYIGKLQELDVTNIEPMTQSLPAPWRRSSRVGARARIVALLPKRTEPPRRRTLPCTIGEDVLAHAPDAAKPFFRVPRVIER